MLTLIQEINASGWIPKKSYEILDKNEKSEEEMKIEKEKEIEAEEKREWEYIKLATNEACRRAGAIIRRRNKNVLLDEYSSYNMCRSQEVDALPQTNSDDEVEVEEMKLKLKMEPSHSARGVWNYTVGLVGKPSAGQNIIYHHHLFSSLLYYIFFITPYVTQFLSLIFIKFSFKLLSTEEQKFFILFIYNL